MNKRRKNTGSEQGFTIIELLIATSVLSVILLLATTVMISIGNLYYKGVNQARIQDSVRSTVDQATQDVEFSNNGVFQGTSVNIGRFYGQSDNSITMNAICLGSARYTYVTGANNLQIGSGGHTNNPPQLEHMLYRDSILSTTGCTPLDLTATDPETGPLTTDRGITGSGQELVPPNSRLLCFSISNGPATPGCGVTTSGPAYGIDVKMAYGDPDLVSSNGTGICTSDAGDQFCAVNELTAIVSPRL